MEGGNIRKRVPIILFAILNDPDVFKIKEIRKAEPLFFFLD